MNRDYDNLQELRKIADCMYESYDSYSSIRDVIYHTSDINPGVDIDILYAMYIPIDHIMSKLEFLRKALLLVNKIHQNSKNVCKEDLNTDILSIVDILDYNHELPDFDEWVFEGLGLYGDLYE